MSGGWQWRLWRVYPGGAGAKTSPWGRESIAREFYAIAAEGDAPSVDVRLQRRRGDRGEPEDFERRTVGR